MERKRGHHLTLTPRPGPRTPAALNRTQAVPGRCSCGSWLADPNTHRCPGIRGLSPALASCHLSSGNSTAFYILYSIYSMTSHHLPGVPAPFHTSGRAASVPGLPRTSLAPAVTAAHSAPKHGKPSCPAQPVSSQPQSWACGAWHRSGSSQRAPHPRPSGAQTWRWSCSLLQPFPCVAPRTELRLPRRRPEGCGDHPSAPVRAPAAPAALILPIPPGLFWT